MIAGFVLVLVLVMPDRSLRSEAFPMQSAAACERDAATWLAGPPRNPMLPPAEEGSLFRSAACLAVPVTGRDA